MLTDTLGLALAMLIWKTVSCITGWAISRFGLFGINAAPPKSGLLNYLGLVLLVLGYGFMYAFNRVSKTLIVPVV
ncbi:unnamed protein product [Anisakis simplex]|uniref:Transmembrane protein 144 (inferred by orthology to a human protein) n=1 Tax=Anisakis simplex TaxID=6269 RepID=A0A0M3JHZ5_ANISI|nr:unnamed protein product [Anisakis simplex]